MKTQKNLIPLVLVTIFLMSGLSSKAEKEPGQKKQILNSSAEALFENENIIHSETLSTKNYVYESENLYKKKEVILFLFEKNAKLTISIDEEGKIHEYIEYFDDTPEKNKLKNESASDYQETSLLDTLRSRAGSIFKEVSGKVFDIGNRHEQVHNFIQEDKKYFKSDYQINEII
ncbi:MAG: hypothetical protein ACQES1_02200 [Bacteroidota bacterium]